MPACQGKRRQYSMSDGKTHARDSTMLAVAAPIGVLALGAAVGETSSVVSLQMTAAVALGCVLGIPFSPDLDINHVTRAERIPFVGPFWYLLWLPYAKVLPHRSQHSHLPGWGTALRQLYFISVIWLLGWLIAMGLGGVTLGYVQTWRLLLAQEWYGWIFAGLLLSDVAHWLRDIF